MRKLRQVLRGSWWLMVFAATVRWFWDPVDGSSRRDTARSWAARLARFAQRRVDEQRHPGAARQLGRIEALAAPAPTHAEGRPSRPATYPGVAQDATTLSAALTEFERRGYSSQLVARDNATVQCMACRRDSKAADVLVDELQRLEGASDPDDMLAVSAVRCPRCGARATLVSQFGPSAPSSDVDILQELDRPRTHEG